MSILSDAWTGKITWATAVQEIEADVSKAFNNNPAATAAAGAILTDLKQAASNAIGYADTAFGALVGPATVTVEATVNALLVRAVGPVSGVVTPSVDLAIVSASNALKSAIDAEAVKFRASLAGPPGA